MLNNDTIPLPNFPEFRNFVLNDKDWYIEFTKDLKPYADYNFSTLMVWFNKTQELEASKLNNNIVFRYPDVLKHTSSMIYGLIGTDNILNTAHNLLGYLQANNLDPKIEMVPEDTINSIDQNTDLLVTEDEDNSEYILDRTLIIELPGKAFSSFREDRNSFINRYKNISDKLIDLKESSNNKLIIDSYNKWSTDTQHKSNDPERSEKEVIESILENADYLGYKCLGVFVDNQLASFVLFHYPSQSEFVSPSVIKIDYNYKDIFDYTVNLFAKKVKETIKYINFEQDMGIEGLRKYKSSLNPIYYLKKYTISQK